MKDAYALGITAVTMIILIVLGRSLWAVYRRFWPQGMRAPDIEETIPMTVVAPPESSPCHRTEGTEGAEGASSQEEEKSMKCLLKN